VGRSAATAGTDTGVNVKKNDSPAAGEPQDPHDLAGMEAGLDALDLVQAGRTPLRETLARKVPPPITAAALVGAR
jgi:NitT/TauT family transport system permease protein